VTLKIRRTEGGHKRGHSNTDHWELTEIIKAETKRKRRRQARAHIKEQMEEKE
jgi:hypothetical protein